MRTGDPFCPPYLWHVLCLSRTLFPQDTYSTDPFCTPFRSLTERSPNTVRDGRQDCQPHWDAVQEIHRTLRYRNLREQSGLVGRSLRSCIPDSRIAKATQDTSVYFGNWLTLRALTLLPVVECPALLISTFLTPVLSPNSIG